MIVIELSCPLCESPVRSPNGRKYTRLHCRKCHTPLHVDRSGRAAIGEPPSVDLELQELKQTIRDYRDRIPIRRIAAGLFALLVIAGPGRYLLGSSSSLPEAARQAANALAADDAGAIRSLAASGTSDDASLWFEEARRQLARQREHWYGKGEMIEVHVAGEDGPDGTRETGISIRPGFGSTRDVSLADPAAATASAASPVNLMTVWTRSWWGGWKLDGRATLEKHRPGPSPPVLRP